MNNTVNGSLLIKSGERINTVTFWWIGWQPVSPSSHTHVIINLFLYYCPFLVISGTIGNVLSIMVFSRKAMKSSATSVYSRFMAANDLAALYTGPLSLYINTCLNIDINAYYDVTCGIYYYRAYFFTLASNYTIVCLTVERLLSVLFPHKVRLWCSKDRSYYVIVLVILLVALANSPVLFWTKMFPFYDEQTNANLTICALPSQPSWLQVWSWFNIAKMVAIPVSVITVGNMILLVQLYGSSPLCSMLRRSRNDRVIGSDVAEMSRRATNRKQRSVIVTLISVCVVFIVCNTPIMLCSFNIFQYTTFDDQCLASAVSLLLMYTNNCLNFLLYCACGTRFRKELISMICGPWRQPVQKTSSIVLSGN